ncbi:MAG: hypothetical protein N5P05_003982 [Chroococcopsis gigantea SAG 12.99]|jgi:hypothetical protein|nr:hypothetical protein [Chroococcopsis gigantea SAG 12.99]
MTILSCQNPECEHFHEIILEGRFCPFCGQRLESSLSTEPITIQETVTKKIDKIPITPRRALKIVHSSGIEFQVSGTQIAYIGRRGGKVYPYPEVDVTDLEYSERVSRPHAHIIWEKQSAKYFLVDDNSTNGTILNGVSLTPGRTYEIKNGAQLELGREHLVKFIIFIT